VFCSRYLLVATLRRFCGDEQDGSLLILIVAL